jgi:hypothetical protein
MRQAVRFQKRLLADPGNSFELERHQRDAGDASSSGE